MKALNENVSIKRYVFGLSVAISLLCGFTFLLTSCNQEEGLSNRSGEEFPQTGEMVTVDFSVSEVEFGESEAVTTRSALSNELETKVIPIADDLYLYATLKEEPAPVKLRALIPLSTGTTVRIVAYTGSPFVYHSHADYTVGGAGGLTKTSLNEFKVPAGNCRFVAYSYNETTAMPGYSATTAAIGDKDILWGDAVVAISGSTSIQIKMKHLQSEITVSAQTDLYTTPVQVLTSVNAAISCYDATLTVSNGVLNPPSSLIQRSLSLVSLNQQVMNGKTLAFNDEKNPITLIINGFNVDGVTYNGPWVLNYLDTMKACKSYHLMVNLRREPPGGSAARITWDAVNSKYAITYDPRDGGLFFKRGSVVSIYTDNDGGSTGRLLTLPIPSPVPAVDLNFVSSRDIVWSPINIPSGSSWSAIPYEPSVLLSPVVHINDVYHTIANVKVGKGDPCRLVGLDLNKIATTPAGSLAYADIDNGIWRLPTYQENLYFMGASLTSNYTVDNFAVTPPGDWWWNKNQVNSISFGVAGIEFPERGKGGVTKFLPAVGFRNGTISSRETTGRYWTSVHSCDLAFELNTIHAYISATGLNDLGTSIRCVHQSMFSVSLGTWTNGGQLGGGANYEGDIHL